MISLTSPVRTRAHGWPAGLKLAALCVTTVVLFWMDSLAGHLLAAVLVVGLYALPGMRFFKTGLRHLRVLWPFVVVLLIWHLATGAPRQGAVIILRMMSAFALANLVTMTTALSDYIDVVKFLMTPFRRLGLRTGPLEIAIALVVRFVPVLVIKGTALSQAWRARAVRRPNWRIILPFAILAIDDADNIAEALRARGALQTDQDI